MLWLFAKSDHNKVWLFRVNLIYSQTLRPGACWKDLPRRFPSPRTCWRWLREWSTSGVFQKSWTRLLGRLAGRNFVNWEDAIADGTSSPAKNAAVGKTNKGNWLHADA